MQAIYFDLDGTIAGLYDVPHWLDKLQSEDVTPYADAKPLVNIEQLQTIINTLQSAGIIVGVISWGAKFASKDYNKQVRKTKLAWCKRHGLKFDEFHVIKYGTPKHHVAKVKNAILVDDDENNLRKWNNGAVVDANNPRKMIRTLQKIALQAIA